jgi:hypothetical protein
MASDDLVRTQIRLPAELHRRLVEAAEQTGRSFNSEMVTRLDESFPASIEMQFVFSRQEELQQLENELRVINSQIAELNMQLTQPSKRKERQQIHEVMASLGRREVQLRRLRDTTSDELSNLMRLASNGTNAAP